MFDRFLMCAMCVALSVGSAVAMPSKKDLFKEACHLEINSLHEPLLYPPLPHTRADELTEVIYYPEGIQKPYTKAVVGLDWGSPFQEEACTSIVFGDNNEVYIQNIILRQGSIGYESFVKGELKDGLITVPVPQTLVEYPGGWGRNVSLMEKGADGEWQVSDIPYITYSVNEDTGVIKSELPGSPGSYAIGLTWSFDDSWNEIGDFIQVFTPYDGEFVTVPEGVELEEYYFNDGYFAYPVGVGIDGNDLYIAGLTTISTSTVVHAVIDGNKGYIPQNELIGTVMGYFIWTKMMEPDPVLGWALLPEDMVYHLDIDSEHKIIKSAVADEILILNCEYDRVFYLDGYVNFTIGMQDSFEGTPRNPYGLSFDGEDFRETYGINGFNFNMSNISVDNTVLDTFSLYYSVYIDGDILEFEQIEGFYSIMYPGVEGVVTRMPYDFTNGYDIDISSVTQRFIGIYPDGVTTVGVQVIYEYDGVTTFSDIVTLNVDTNEITTETGKVETINNEDVVDIVYYDLSGRKISKPSNGLFIKQYILSDGNKVSHKILLR